MAIVKHKTKKNCWIVDCRPNGYMGKRVRRPVTGTREEAEMVERAMMGDVDDRIVYSTMSCFREMDKRGPAVYFIREGLYGPIKIGYSSKGLFYRLKELQTSNSSVLYPVGALIGGTKETEKELHKRFSHLKVKGEWFRPAAELVEYISVVRLWPTIYAEPNIENTVDKCGQK